MTNEAERFLTKLEDGAKTLLGVVEKRIMLSPLEKIDLILERIYHMALNLDALETAVAAVVAQDGADKAALTQAQSDLAAAQADATAAQAKIDALTAQLNAVVTPAVTGAST